MSFLLFNMYNVCVPIVCNLIFFNSDICLQNQCIFTITKNVWKMQNSQIYVFYILPRAPALYYDARSKCIEVIFCVHAKKRIQKIKFKLWHLFCLIQFKYKCLPYARLLINVNIKYYNVQTKNPYQFYSGGFLRRPSPPYTCNIYINNQLQLFEVYTH